MKAIKIDVANKEILEIEIGKGLQNIYDAIGCELFCCPVTWENQDTLYADDEALLKDDIVGCFAFPDFNYPIVGNALILGTNDEGESVDAKTSIAELKEKIIWGNREVAEMWREKNIG